MGGFRLKDLLLIIDMQNVYMPGQPWECPSMPAALKQIRRLLDSPFCKKAYDVVFTRYIASEHPSGCWKQYNKNNYHINSNPFLNQIVPQLQPYLMKWPFYDKSTYSACSIPQIMEQLSFYRRVLISGVVAECCVLFTVEGLIDAGAQIFYLKDAVSGKSSASEQMACQFTAQFIPVHTKVLTVGSYLQELSSIFPDA